MVSYVEVIAADAGQRLDNFLMRQLKGVPRQHVYKILRSGEVRVNGSRCKPSLRVAAGDRVRIPPIRTREQAPARVSEEFAAIVETLILYEDDDFLVLDKPHGMAVHAGTSVSSGLVEQVRIIRRNPRLELIHRLDRETSGCLALAKKPSALRRAQRSFRDGAVKKRYELFVVGRWPRRIHSVTAPLERVASHWGERRVRVSAQGKAAQTNFEILEACAQATWLQASLLTGRTHQIRVHAQSVGCPIIGDTKYGQAGQGLDPPRMCLHSTKLELPLGDMTISVTAPLPRTLIDYWAVLSQAG